MFVLRLTSKARKQLRKLQWKDQQRIELAMSDLTSDPFAGKKLEGKFEGLYATRVWPYRILYMIDRQIVTVTVVAIGHRKDIYRIA